MIKFRILINNNKSSLNLIILVLFCLSCISKTKKSEIIANGRKSSITFKKELHDFGEIPANKEATALFNFSNLGETPLVVTDVKTSCGCTVPEYPKNIIKSGENGEIKVIYDAKYPGRFNKTVRVYYNGINSPKKLTIKGEVPYPKESDSIN